MGVTGNPSPLKLIIFKRLSDLQCSGSTLTHINYLELNVDDDCKLLLRKRPHRIEMLVFFSEGNRLFNLHFFFRLTRNKFPNLGSNSQSSLPGSYPLTIRLIMVRGYEPGRPRVQFQIRQFLSCQVFVSYFLQSVKFNMHRNGCGYLMWAWFYAGSSGNFLLPNPAYGPVLAISFVCG